MGGWWPWSEVSNFPTRAVLAGDSVGLQAAPAPLAPVFLPPPTLPWVMALLNPTTTTISATCPQDGHQPPPGSQPLLLVASEAGVDLQRKRRKNTTGKIVVICSSQSPQPPPNPAVRGGWKWRHGAGRWKKEEAGKCWQTFPPPLALSHHPCWDPHVSFPRAGQAQNAPARWGSQAVTGQCQAGTLLSPPSR